MIQNLCVTRRLFPNLSFLVFVLKVGKQPRRILAGEILR